MVEICNGDVLDSGADIICHQVNCRGVMGAGIARQIKKRYYWAYEQYKARCNKYKGSDLLGTCFFSIDYRDARSPIIANLFGQVYYGTDKQYTDLENGLFPALRHLHRFVEKSELFHIAIPYGMGCGLGGANWDDVYNFILDEFGSDEFVHVYIYKL